LNQVVDHWLMLPISLWAN